MKERSAVYKRQELGKAVFEQAAHRSQNMLKMVVSTLKSINAVSYTHLQNGLARNLLQHRVKAESGRASGTIRTLSNDI